MEPWKEKDNVGISPPLLCSSVETQLEGFRLLRALPLGLSEWGQCCGLSLEQYEQVQKSRTFCRDPRLQLQPKSLQNFL